MPDTQLRFTTNGLLLHKYFDILDVVQDVGNIVFKITVHQPTAELERIIKQIFGQFNWSPVTEYGIDRWVTDNNVRLQINRPTTFIKTFISRNNSICRTISHPLETR